MSTLEVTSMMQLINREYSYIDDITLSQYISLSGTLVFTSVAAELVVLNGREVNSVQHNWDHADHSLGVNSSDVPSGPPCIQCGSVC